MRTGSAYSWRSRIPGKRLTREPAWCTRPCAYALSRQERTMRKPLELYAVFHLNMAYSSIEEERRADLIRSSYWPLLELAARRRLPFGIEATGYTLEEIARLDGRSEEHTSELQSRLHLVCRLLLEKK